MNLAPLLAVITEVVVLVITLALAIYLLSISMALRDATRYLDQLTDGLTRLERETESLSKNMSAVQGGQVQLLTTLRAAKEHLKQPANSSVGEQLKPEPAPVKQNGHNGGSTIGAPGTA